MDRDDVEGAIAAAQYFLELYPYAYQTGDLSEWREMSHPECIFCASVMENVEELHTQGGYKEGGEVLFESVEAIPLGDGPSFAVDFEVTQRGSTDYDASGEPVRELESKQYRMQTIAVRSENSWLVREITPTRIG